MYSSLRSANCFDHSAIEHVKVSYDHATVPLTPYSASTTLTASLGGPDSHSAFTCAKPASMLMRANYVQYLKFIK